MHKQLASGRDDGSVGTNRFLLCVCVRQSLFDFQCAWFILLMLCTSASTS